MQRLLWLRGNGPAGLDVGSLVSSQPSLLLQPLSSLSESSSPSDALSEEEARLLLEEGEEEGEKRDQEEEGETPEELLRSWRAGLVSDSKNAWIFNFLNLKRYIAENGDAAVGTRGGDDPSLVRWAEKQRADYAGVVVGEGGGSFRRRRRAPSSSQSFPSTSSSSPSPFLKPSRRALLASVGFCFDAEEAEFRRMVAAAARAGAGGEGSGGSGAATATREIGGRSGSGTGSVENSSRGDELLLANWCSVQRIARRSGVLSEDRIAQLEAIGFDFDGADALS